MPSYDVFFFGALFFILGVLFASLNFKIWTLILTGALILLFLTIGIFTKRKRFFWFSALSLFMLAGSLFYTWNDLRFKSNINIPYDKKTDFLGVIVRNPVIKIDSQELVVRLAAPFEGNILIRTALYPRFNYGDELEVYGKIEHPFTDSYAKYLEKERIAGTVFEPKISVTHSEIGFGIKSWLFDFRNNIADSFIRVLPAKEAAFLTGLTLGGTSGLPKEFKDAMSESGTTHLVALSGYNISIIVIAAMAVFLNFFRRRISFVLTSILILLFVVMTGAEASVVRAAVMGFLILFAREAGRAYHFRNAVIFVGLLMILWNPKVLVFDVGFELSFLALLGIIYLKPAIESFLNIKGKKSLFAWKENLFTTASAQIAVLPILVLNFGGFSPTSLIANVLVLAAIPLTMSLGFLIAGLSLVLYWPSILISWVALIFLKYEIWIIELFAKFSFKISPAFTIWAFLVYYALVIIFIVYVERNKIFTRKA